MKKELLDLFSVETQKGREFDSGRAAGSGGLFLLAGLAGKKGIDRLSAPAAESLGLGRGGSAASAASNLTKIRIR